MDKNKDNNSLVDFYLRKAVMSYVEQERSKLDKLINESVKDSTLQPSESANKRFHEYLLKVEEKEKKSKQKKSIYRVFRLVAIIGLCFLIVTSVSIFTVEAFRIRVMNLFRNVTDSYTEINLFEKNEQIAPDHLDLKEILPESFNIIDIKKTEDSITVTYQDEDSEAVVKLVQNKAEVKTNLDTENAKTEEININDYFVFVSIKDEFYNFVWQRDEYYYVLSSNLEKEYVIIILNDFLN